MTFRDFAACSFLVALSLGNLIPSEAYHTFWGMAHHDRFERGTIDAVWDAIQHALPIWIPVVLVRFLYDWYYK